MTEMSVTKMFQQKNSLQVYFMQERNFAIYTMVYIYVHTVKCKVWHLRMWTYLGK